MENKMRCTVSIPKEMRVLADITLGVFNYLGGASSPPTPPPLRAVKLTYNETAEKIGIAFEVIKTEAFKHKRYNIKNNHEFNDKCNDKSNDNSNECNDESSPVKNHATSQNPSKRKRRRPQKQSNFIEEDNDKENIGKFHIENVVQKGKYHDLEKENQNESLSDYEKIRLENIAERDKMFKQFKLKDLATNLRKPLPELKKSYAPKPLWSDEDDPDYMPAKHMLAKNSGKPKKLKTVNECDKCKITFRSLSLLKIHVRAVHEGKKDYKCEHCENSFSRPSTLFNHIKNIHKQNPKNKSKNVESSNSSSNEDWNGLDSD